MANTIILKKSSVVGKVPLTSDLTFGEVALNYADGKIYYKNTTTNIDFVGNGGTYTNVLRIANSTTTVTPNTGALVVDGGVGIGDTLHVGGVGHFGLEPTITLANPLAVFTGNANGYNQIQIQNISTGLLASSDIVATANDGDDITHYIDMGINNNNFSSVDWTMSGPRDGYIYVAGNNLTLGTDEPGKEVRIHVGGTLAADVVAIFREPDTASTSDITGSFNVNGGAGITGDVHIGETLHIGANPLTALSNTLMIGTANIDGFTQVSIQNRNAGPSASADFVVTADDGNDTTGYIDLGLNNSGYSNVDWTISGPRDGYLYVAGNNLTLGTDSTGTTVKIHVGGTLEENIVATFNEANTQSTSTTTGALQVTGGAGIGGNLYVGGTINGNLTGTATSANSWTTSRTITLGGDLTGSVSINGTSNVTLTATIAADSVALGTDTTGNYVASGATSGFGLSGSSNSEGGTFTVTSNATSTNAISTLVFRDTSGNFSAGTITASLTGNVTGNLTGTATTATNADKWTTARTITLGGDLSGSVSIDGSAGVTLTATIAADSVALGTDTTGIYVASGTTSGFGLSGSSNSEGGTFTVTSNATATNTANTIVYRDPSGNFSAGTITASLTGNVTGTATTATNLAGGAQGGIPYQTAAGTTAFTPIGTDGFVLRSNGSTATWVSTSSLGISGGSSGVSSITAGTDTAVSTTTGAVTVWNTGTLQSVTNRGATTDQAVSITNTTSATSTATGALQIRGGVGVGGALYINTTSFINGAQILTSATVNSFVTAGVSSITAGTDTAVSTTTGAVTVWNNSTLQTVTSRGATTNQAVSITNTTSATSTTTGALTVSGGVGVGGNLYVNGNIVVRDAPIIRDASTTSVLTSAVTLDSFAAATYRSAQYLISVSNAGLGEFQTSDILVVHNGTTAFAQVTSVFSGNKAIMNFNATLSGGNVLLQGTGSGTGANPNIVKVQKTYITI